MSTRRKLLAAVLAALLAPAAAAAPSLASRGISVAPGGPIALNPPVNFNFGGIAFSCTAQINGTLSRNILKQAGAGVGTITGAVIGTCTNRMSAFFLINPDDGWPMTFVTFTGSLPNIGTIQFVFRNVSVLIGSPLSNCLYGGTLGGWISVTGGPPTPGPLTLPLLSGSPCPRNLGVGFVGTITPAQRYALF